MCHEFRCAVRVHPGSCHVFAKTLNDTSTVPSEIRPIRQLFLLPHVRCTTPTTHLPCCQALLLSLLRPHPPSHHALLRCQE